MLHLLMSMRSLLAIIQSIMAAFFGVQKSKNHHRDFSQRNPLHFIVGGLIATLLFILVLLGIVKWVLWQSY